MHPVAFGRVGRHQHEVCNLRIRPENRAHRQHQFDRLPAAPTVDDLGRLDGPSSQDSIEDRAEAVLGFVRHGRKAMPDDLSLAPAKPPLGCPIPELHQPFARQPHNRERSRIDEGLLGTVGLPQRQA